MTPDTTDFNSLNKKQLVELVIAKYNDCFRLEEENKNLKEKIELLDNENMCLNAEIKDRKEENKKLKENYNKLDKVASENVRTLDELEAERIELAEENKRLKKENEELEEYKRMYEGLG